jgi:hypothetical protein
MEQQRIKILDQIQMVDSGDVLGPEEATALSHLKARYNEIVETIYQNTPGPFWDIIEVFPEDIWIQIIQYALPTSQYAAALLTLTMVSSKWFHALLSIPILWSHIEICGSNGDSLATIGAFTHLSNDAPLTLTVYLPVRSEATTLQAAMSFMGGRIQQVVIIPDRRLQGPSPSRPFSDSDNLNSGFRFLFDSAQYIFDAIRVDLRSAPTQRATHGHRGSFAVGEHGQFAGGGGRLTYGHEVLQMVDGFPPHRLREMFGCCVCVMPSLDSLRYLERFRTCVTLDRLAPHLENMVQLRSLTLAGWESYDKTHQDKRVLSSFENLSNLTAISFGGSFHLSWWKLLAALAPNLVHLKIDIPPPQLCNGLEVLQFCIRLRELSFCVREWKPGDEGDIELNRTLRFAIPDITSLRSLTFTVTHNPGNTQIQEQLTVAINHVTAMYRTVEEASFTIHFAKDEKFTTGVLSCISELPNLRRLYFDGSAWPFMPGQQPVTVLKMVEALDTAFPEAFHTPRLWSAIWRCGLSDHINMLEYDNVRTLHMHDNDFRPHSTKFSRDHLPRLINLQIFLNGSRHVRLGSFLALTSISIESSQAGVTSLCIALLYQPEDCPCLEDIEFLESAPEWDILFIMLERRNFLINPSVSRVRRISLPFISNELRAPLACLLRGKYTARPSNKDLSFKETLGLIFDKNM